MAKNIFSTNYTLGILGGGQLGKMMLYTTRKFDIRTKVLDPSPDAPAQFGANEFQVGSLQDYDTVMAFAADCDTVCIEIEAVNVQALRDLRAQGKKSTPESGQPRSNPRQNQAKTILRRSQHPYLTL